eukprot:761551-Hanusia_phi.AAC.5
MAWVQNKLPPSHATSSYLRLILSIASFRPITAILVLFLISSYIIFPELNVAGVFRFLKLLRTISAYCDPSISRALYDMRGRSKYGVGVVAIWGGVKHGSSRITTGTETF